MRTLKYKLSRDILIMLYYANFHSLISYGIVLWGQGSYWKDVFIAQKKAIRIINGKEWNEDGLPISCRSLFRKFGILTLPSLYIYECVKFILISGNQFDRFSGIHGYNTRNKDNFSLAHHKRTLFETTVYYMGSLFTNKFNNMKDFKGKLNLKTIKEYLTDRQFYTVDEFLCV